MRVITALAVMLFVRLAAAAPSPYEKSPSPPRAFEGIRPGMALVEAKPVLAAFAWDATYVDAAGRKRLVMNAGDGARYYVLVTGETIARIGIEAPERGLEARLTRMWGTPVVAKNPANETLTTWAKQPWRVDLACRGALCRIAFHETLSTAFFGSTVAPPGALAALRPGMSRDDVAKLAPHHAAGADVPSGFEDVHVKVDIAKTGTLRSVVIVGLPADAKTIATKAWGEPTASDRGPMWIGDRGWRAFYDPELRAMELVPHVTVAQILGTGPGIAALARPVLGATPDQIAAAYPTFARDGKGATLALPPIEAGTRPTTVGLALDPSHRVNALTIALPYADPAARTALVQLLASKWGKPTHKAQGPTVLKSRTPTLVFPTGKVRIQAKDTGSAFELSIAI